ncbi:PREDICTED: uncharacterized protein LOC106806282 [Priapulus caudatus]|uniref:Uncharacterized protein LOC106806282 n=1 Tax=Priapulus caudatus TaxID=37621 RepID=A0ABM1DUN0_PRICU|nr:PREDICTED: uncharacterized protein LOC106806282 [Priapulus caudatus]
MSDEETRKPQYTVFDEQGMPEYFRVVITVPRLKTKLRFPTVWKRDLDEQTCIINEISFNKKSFKFDVTIIQPRGSTPAKIRYKLAAQELPGVIILGEKESFYKFPEDGCAVLCMRKSNPGTRWPSMLGVEASPEEQRAANKQR